MVDSLFKRISKIYFFHGGVKFWGGTAEEKWAIKGHLLLCQMGVVNFERQYQPLPIGITILVVPQFSNMPDQILGEK